MRNWHARLRTWLRSPRRRSPIRTLVIESLEDRITPSGDVLGPAIAQSGVTATSGGVDAGTLVGMDTVRATSPYTGKGYSVAILDTGIDYNAPDLGGGWGNKVIAGYDFVNNDSDPMDDNGHGSFVAGEIAGTGSAFPGIAPGANLIALKVLDANANGTWQNIEAGLQWVIAHQAQYNIVAVNLSLGSGNYTVNPSTYLSSDFATLVKDNVFISVAAGNGFVTDNSQPGLDYPAIDPNVVSVGAVWAANFGSQTISNGADYTTAPDRMVSIGQRSSGLDLVAPGAWIESTWDDGTYHVMGGTSMAAAVVTGAAVLLHQAYDAKGEHSLTTQASLLKLMQQTGVTVNDGDDENDNVVNTGLNFQRLNLAAALAAIGLPAPPTFAALPNEQLGATAPVTLALSATSSTNLPITWTAAIAPTSPLANPPVTLKITGGQLTLTPTGPFTGSFIVQVTASDGITSTTRTFTVTSLNRPPVLTAIANRTVSHAADTVSLPIMATDPDGDKVSLSASLVPSGGQIPNVGLTLVGNQLTLVPARSFVGTFSVEVSASDGLATASEYFSVTVLNTPPVLAAIATQAVSHRSSLSVMLSASDADGDALQFTAAIVPTAAPAPASVYVAGSQVVIAPAGWFVGSFVVNVSASDGAATVTQSFTVNVTNAAPTLNPAATVTLAAGQTSLTVPVNASDADGDPLQITAALTGGDAVATALKQKLGLLPYDMSSYTNLEGKNEKWIAAQLGAYYILLPNGQLYRWTNNITQTLTAANLVATVATSYYANPMLLSNPTAPPPTTVTVTVQGNTIVVQRPASVKGTYTMQITVSDGFATTTRTIQIVLG